MTATKKAASAAEPKTVAAAEDTGSVDTSNVALSPVPGATDVDLAKPDELEPATLVEASGAMIEPTIVDRIDTSHPAVDNEPRKGQPVIANRIDFNDPHATGSEAVENNLKDQAAG